MSRIDKFWVVVDPSPISELGDIWFGVDTRGLVYYILGGGKSVLQERIAVYTDSTSSRKDAEARLAWMQSRKSSIDRVGSAYTITASMSKTAGEVRFVKDTSDGTDWAYGGMGHNQREMSPDYAFNPKNAKSLARVMRGCTAALGHLIGGYNIFAKLKSADISPDGKLGGRGYIQDVSGIRRKMMNSVEALSSLVDTLYDEVRAPHWAAVSRQEDPNTRMEIENILKHTDQIRQNPEEWAKGEIKEDQDQRVGK